MLRMIELADETPNIEYTPTAVLQELLSTNHNQSASLGEFKADNFSGNDASDEEESRVAWTRFTNVMSYANKLNGSLLVYFP